MHSYLIPLIDSFKENIDPDYAVGMKKYMKDQFDYFGIRTPDRKALTKDFIKQNGLPVYADLETIVKDLWLMKERECQYSAIFILKECITDAPKDIIKLLEYMILNKSWWDTVDGIASWLVGTLFSNNPDMIVPKTTEWMESDNIWLQRTCLLFQLGYKEKTDLELLFGFIKRLSSSDVFWINKAIGWILREYSKTDPGAVIDFVENNQISGLSRREALKVINKRK